MHPTRIAPGALVVVVGPPQAGQTEAIDRWIGACGAADTAVMSLMGLARRMRQSPQATIKPFHDLVALHLQAGRTTIIAGGNLVASERRALVELARKHHTLAIAVRFSDNFAALAAKIREAHLAITPQMLLSELQALEESTEDVLKVEGFSEVISGDHEIQFLPDNWDARKVKAPLFIFGDVHGCFQTLKDALANAGFSFDEAGDLLPHPEGTIPVSVGDLHGKGPHPVKVLRWMMRQHRAGSMLVIRGNWEQKLALYLETGERNVPRNMAITLAAVDSEPDAQAFAAELAAWIRRLPTYLAFGKLNPQDRNDISGVELVVSHAGFRPDLVGNTDYDSSLLALYNLDTEHTPAGRQRVRSHWKAQYEGSAVVVHGHTVVEAAAVTENSSGGAIVSLDTGAYKGGGMSGYAWPQRELSWVPTAESERGTDADSENDHELDDESETEAQALKV